MNETPNYADWIGRTTQLGDVISAAPVKAMSATLFDTAPFSVCGRFDDTAHATLWARGPQGQLAMQARATIA